MNEKLQLFEDMVNEIKAIIELKIDNGDSLSKIEVDHILADLRDVRQQARETLTEYGWERLSESLA